MAKVRVRITEKGIIEELVHDNEPANTSINTPVIINSYMDGYRFLCLKQDTSISIQQKSSVVILVDACKENIFLQLPDITNSSDNGLLITIKKIDKTSNNVILKPFNSQMIDYLTELIVNIPLSSVCLISYENNWWII